MDYSLMVAVDEVKSSFTADYDLTNASQARKELVVGIIDVVRTYTWVSKTKSWFRGPILILVGQEA